MCVVHGSWGSWGPWSDCDACAGVSVRQRVCNSPPARFGGLPCHGESRQTRGCHDNITVCTGTSFHSTTHTESTVSPHTSFPLISSDCGGGQEFWPCGKPCPRSCSDLHGDTECVDAPGCSPSCGCPGDMMLQDGVCVERDLCRCKYHNSSTCEYTHRNIMSLFIQMCSLYQKSDFTRLLFNLRLVFCCNTHGHVKLSLTVQMG